MVLAWFYGFSSIRKQRKSSPAATNNYNYSLLILLRNVMYVYRVTVNLIIEEIKFIIEEEIRTFEKYFVRSISKEFFNLW